jgi:hypothetical protein
MIGVRIPEGAGNFFFRHRVQTSSGAHPTSYPMGNRGSFPGGTAAGGVKLTTRLHPVPRSENAWSYTSTPQYVFMAWCLVKHRDNFTFTFIRLHNVTWLSTRAMLLLSSVPYLTQRSNHHISFLKNSSPHKIIICIQYRPHYNLQFLL